MSLRRSFYLSPCYILPHDVRYIRQTISTQRQISNKLRTEKPFHYSRRFESSTKQPFDNDFKFDLNSPWNKRQKRARARARFIHMERCMFSLFGFYWSYVKAHYTPRTKELVHTYKTLAVLAMCGESIYILLFGSL